MGYKRELRKPLEYDGRKSLFTDLGGIRDDIPAELKDMFKEAGGLLESFGVPYLKRIVYCYMYHAYNINRP